MTTLLGDNAGQTGGMKETLSSAARVAFMIGHPVSHTAMPTRLNAMIARQDRAMIPVDVPSAALRAFVTALRATENVDGWVVTAPHKQTMHGLVDHLTKEAASCGLVNLAWMSEGVLWGDNSDGVGFCNALADNHIPLTGQRILIFGAGGAGSAIAHALGQQDGNVIDVCDPDTTRTESLVRALAPIARRIDPPDTVAKYDLVVNATAVGLDGHSLVHDLTGLRSQAVVADVPALPGLSHFLSKAQSLGARVLAGQEMAHAQIPIVVDRFGWPLK